MPTYPRPHYYAVSAFQGVGSCMQPSVEFALPLQCLSGLLVPA
jgi:hypothetical protein